MIEIIVIVFLRPIFSFRMPDMRPPIAAPIRRLEVTMPSDSGVRPRSAFIGSRAPLMTPVS